MVGAKAAEPLIDEHVDFVKRARANENEQQKECKPDNRTSDRPARPARTSKQDYHRRDACGGEGKNEEDLIFVTLRIPAMKLRLDPAGVGQKGLQVELLVDAQEDHDER